MIATFPTVTNGATASKNRELIDSMYIMLKEHDKILIRGNGIPSLTEDMRSVRRDLQEIIDNFGVYKKEEKESRQYWTRLIVGVLIGQVATGIVAVAVMLIRYAPVLEKIQVVTR